MAPVSVLIVEDFDDYRRFLRTQIQQNTRCRLIGEASDGLEAIRLAQECRPGLILLDVGLPKLNGIETARQILKHSPDSKILFVSQNSSIEIVEAALQAGALGYLLKSDATELPIAVDSVLHGKPFVSSSLEAWHSSRPMNARGTAMAHCHEVTFYADDVSLLDGYARFIGSALKSETAVIVLVTEAHRVNLFPRLEADGLDMAAAIEQGNYIEWDTADALSRSIVADMTDPVRCAKGIGDRIVAAAKRVKNNEDARVVVCGEIAPTLLSHGNAEGAIQVEHLWNEIARDYGVHTVCGYLWSAFPDKESDLTFKRICAEHSAVRNQGY
jgi:DNA-binding NarL/FixJ family response regulator